MVSPADVSEGEAATALRGGRSLALAVLCVILFLTFLDNTVVSVALGAIQSELHAGVTALQWVVGAYALTFAGAMLGFGMVGDEFGRKRVMVIGIIIFCGGSLMSALAQNVGLLIAGRAVMGFGAAASEPGTLSMIRHVYTDERERSWALGVWTAVSGVALAMGPVIGGALIGSHGHWRNIFWFNLVVGALALVGAIAVLPENADPDGHRVDIAGTVLGAAALSALAFAVITAEGSSFSSTPVVLLLCVSAASVVGFFWWESKAPHPLLDLKYLRVPRFLVANVVAFCAYFATFAVFFFTALYLEEVAGYSGYKIALVFLPMMILMAAAALVAARLTVDVGPRADDFHRLPAVRARAPADLVRHQPEPWLPVPGRRLVRHRHRRRQHGGPGHVVGPVGSATRAVGHGRLHDEHQSRGRGRHRGGSSRRARVRQVVS